MAGKKNSAHKRKVSDRKRECSNLPTEMSDKEEPESIDGENQLKPPPFFVPTIRHVFFASVVYLMLVHVFPWVTQRMDHLEIRVEGYVAPGFEAVALAFRENFEDHSETDGAAFAAYHRGKLIVDLWGGYSDRESEQPWKNDTMSMFFSVTKSLCALSIAVLHDRGLIDYDNYVWRYWPEFGDAGKKNITVAMLMSHQAGLVTVQPRLNLSDIQNFQQLGHILAKQQPLWPPGTQHGYHVYTYGWYVDQLVRRVDLKHRSVGQFFQEEIAKPFGIELYMALPRVMSDRVARLREPTGIWNLLQVLRHQNSRRIFFHNLFYPSSISSVAIGNTSVAKNMQYNDPTYREVENPSVNGIGTARSMAKLYSILANRGMWKDQRLLSEKTVEKLLVPIVHDYDVVLLFKEAISIGFKIVHNSKGQGVFGHQGYGMQAGFADPSNRLSWAFLSNYLAEEPRGEHPRYMKLRDALYNCVNKL